MVDFEEDLCYAPVSLAMVVVAGRNEMSSESGSSTLWVILGPFAASAAWARKEMAIAKKTNTAMRRCENMVDGEVVEEGGRGAAAVGTSCLSLPGWSLASAVLGSSTKGEGLRQCNRSNFE